MEFGEPTLDKLTTGLSSPSLWRITSILWSESRY